MALVSRVAATFARAPSVLVSMNDRYGAAEAYDRTGEPFQQGLKRCTSAWTTNPDDLIEPLPINGDRQADLGPWARTP